MSIYEEQKDTALKSMTEWLMDKHELGKEPYKILLANEFDLHSLHYFVFKYKKNAFSKWLLGVCGGYDEYSTENCGHVFSDMKEYHEKTAIEDAINIVEGIRHYYMELAKMDCSRKDEVTENYFSGIFTGFVLLDKLKFDVQNFKHTFSIDWDFEYTDFRDKDETVSFTCEDGFVTIGYMNIPVPNDEAVKNAESNYEWEEAVSVTKQHVAHLIVSVVPIDKEHINYKNNAITFVKVASSLLKLCNSTGLNFSGTVFRPSLYIRTAQMISDGDFPLLNLVYFGLYRTQAGMNGYTYGLRSFGKEEIEVIGTDRDPLELKEFLYNISYYIVDSDVTLKDGDTIGFSADQKLTINYSKGISIDGNTLKIGF